MYCLDTNIIIFYLDKQNQKLADTYIREALFNNLCTTPITAFELLYYCYKHNSTKKLAIREQAINYLSIFDFDVKSAKIFAQLKVKLQKSGNIIEDADLQIASICLANNLTLITNNSKHFERIDGLKVEDWTI